MLGSGITGTTRALERVHAAFDLVEYDVAENVSRYDMNMVCPTGTLTKPWYC